MDDLSQTVTLIDNKEGNDDRTPRTLVTAVACDANFVISGDKKLLKLHPFRGIGIYSPKDFGVVYPV